MVAEQHRRRSTARAVAALAGVAGLLAGAEGCAAGGPAADDRHEDVAVAAASVPASTHGEATVRGAADALAAARSSRAVTSMEMAAGGTEVTIRGEGGYDFGRRIGRLTLTPPQDAAGASPHRPITELLSPATLYMKNRGAGVPADKWVKVDSGSLADGNLVTGGATDPLAAAELLRTARRVRDAGPARVSGATVRHYTGVCDLAEAARAASPYVREAFAAAEKGFASRAVPFDAYLDPEGRPRRVTYRFSYLNGGTPVTVDSTTRLYDFGAAVTVRLPPADEIFAGTVDT